MFLYRGLMHYKERIGVLFCWRKGCRQKVRFEELIPISISLGLAYVCMAI